MAYKKAVKEAMVALLNDINDDGISPFDSDPYFEVGRRGEMLVTGLQTPSGHYMEVEYYPDVSFEEYKAAEAYAKEYFTEEVMEKLWEKVQEGE